MKKVIVSAVVGVLFLGGVSFVSASSTKSYALEFARDYSTAIATFQLDGRTYLVQENPQTELELMSKTYWILNQILDLMKAQLAITR